MWCGLHNELLMKTPMLKTVSSGSSNQANRRRVFINFCLLFHVPVIISVDTSSGFSLNLIIIIIFFVRLAAHLIQFGREGGAFFSKEPGKIE